MFEFKFFDNIIDFITEFHELLKEDWKKFKIFVKENKGYLIYLFIALITLQITDVMSLGNSWNKYCKKNNIQNIQYGGGNAEPSKLAGEDPSKLPEAPPEKTSKELKAEKKAKKKEAKSQAKADSGEDSVKSVDKKLGFFNKLKGKIDGTGKNGMAGPVLGNLDGLFKAVEGLFAFLTVILIILGIMSLPVLIFMVLTYMVLKTMVGKLALY